MSLAERVSLWVRTKYYPGRVQKLTRTLIDEEDFLPLPEYSPTLGLTGVHEVHETTETTQIEVFRDDGYPYLRNVLFIKFAGYNETSGVLYVNWYLKVDEDAWVLVWSMSTTVKTQTAFENNIYSAMVARVIGIRMTAWVDTGFASLKADNHPVVDERPHVHYDQYKMLIG